MLQDIQIRIQQACIRSKRSPDDVILVAVTKGRTAEEVAHLYDQGIRDFAENRPQQLLERKLLFPEANWHLIGHLQKNKVAKVVRESVLIHSVGSLELLEKVITEAEKERPNNKVISLLLQVNLLADPKKQGFSRQNALLAFQKALLHSAVDVKGIMTMAPPLHSHGGEVRETFKKTKELFDELCGLKPLMYLSMGMSDDFEIAIEEGATVVRIGRALFE